MTRQGTDTFFSKEKGGRMKTRWFHRMAAGVLSAVTIISAVVTPTSAFAAEAGSTASSSGYEVSLPTLETSYEKSIEKR